MSQSSPNPGQSQHHPQDQPRTSTQTSSQASSQTPATNSVQDHLQAQNDHLNAQAAVMLTEFLVKIRLPLGSELLNDVLCTICSEPFLRGDNPEIPVRIDCGHIFGMNCILKWLSPVSHNGKNSCPNCRKPIFEHWNRMDYPPPQRRTPPSARSGISPALNARNSSDFPVRRLSASSVETESLSDVDARISAARVITAEPDAATTSTSVITANPEVVAPDQHLRLHQRQGTPGIQEAVESGIRFLQTMDFHETPYVPSPSMQARARETSSTTSQNESNGAVVSQSNEESARRAREAEVRSRDVTRESNPERSRGMERTPSAQGSSSTMRQRESNNVGSVHNENGPARQLREAKTRLRDAEAGLREAETRYDEARTRNIESTGSFERQVRREYGLFVAARMEVEYARSAAVRIEREQMPLNQARGRQIQREASGRSEAPLPTTQRFIHRPPVTPTAAPVPAPASTPAPVQARPTPDEDAYIGMATMFAVFEADYDLQQHLRQLTATNERKRRLWLQFCEGIVQTIEHSPSNRTTAVTVALDIISLASIEEFITERRAGSPKWQRILRTFPRLHTELVTRFDDFRPMPFVSIAHCIELEHRLADHTLFDVPTLHRARWYTRLSERVAAAMEQEHSIASLTERMADLAREGAGPGTSAGAGASTNERRITTQAQEDERV